MPEGPSIALLRDSVSIFSKQKILSAEGRAEGIDFTGLQGNKITGVSAWGKHLFLQLNGSFLDIHLMLFGSCMINKETGAMPSLHLELDKGELNFYACRVLEQQGIPKDYYDSTVDVLNPGFDTARALIKMNDRPKELICDVLLDQHIFSGIGNKLKDEILFKARVHPQSITSAVPEKIKKEMAAYAPSLAHKFLGWIQDGQLTENMQAYSHKFCPRDKAPFLRGKLGRTKRNATFCEVCQELYT